MRIKNKNIFWVIITFALNIIISFLFSLIYKEELILYLSIPFAISFSFLLLLISSRGTNKIILKITLLHDSRIFLVVFSVFSIVSIIIIPASNISILEWTKIPPLSIVRYISALFLTSFLPGFLIIKLVDKKREIKGAAMFVISYLLSIFVSFLIGFIILLSSNPITIIAPSVVLTINLLLLLIYCFIDRSNVDRNIILNLDLFEKGIVFSIFAEIFFASLFVMISNMPLTHGDMRTHFGFALQFSQRFPVYDGKMVVYQGGYLYYIYLAVLFSLSGIPPALAEQGLFIFSFISILAFYSAISEWFQEKEKKIPIIATFLSILLGFGSLYSLYLKYAQPSYSIMQILSISTSKTYDIYARVLLLPDIVAPTWNIGLPTFFILLYFLKKNCSNYVKGVVVPTLTATGWLGHIAEVIIFIVILFIYKLLYWEKTQEKLSLYMILGLFLVILVDLMAPAQFYLRSLNGTFSIPFLASLFLTILITVMDVIKDKLQVNFMMKIKSFILKILIKSWKLIRWSLLYVYIFSLVVWLNIEKNFDLWEWGGTLFVPFFVFPLRFGAVGLLVFMFIFLYFTEIISDKDLAFFLIFIPLGFIMEQAASYGLLPFYPAYRYATITFIGALVIASFGIIKIVNYISKSKSLRLKAFLYVILTFLLIVSHLSTCLYYVNASYYSYYAKISQGELDALNYLRQHLPQNSSILTFTMRSATNLRNFAGVNPVQDAQRWSNLILSTSNPYIITYVLGLSKVKYIFMSQEDTKLVRSNRVLTSMINYFPKVFENDYVTIYEVPSLTPPSSNASLGVIYIPPSIQQGNNVWIDDSFTEGWHPFRHYGKIKSYGWEMKNGILTISVTSNQSGNVWISYAYSGLKLNTSVYSVLTFRYRVENDYTWFTLQLWNSSNKVFFYIGHQTDKEFTTKIFTLPENQMITRIEIIVETVEDAPADTTARAYVDYIEIAKGPFDSVNVLPALLTASLQSKYSFLYVDDTLLENLRTYLSHYSRIILTSDPKISVRDLLSWVSSGGKIVVFNTHGNGFFANLLEIDKSNTSLTVRNYGLGKIAYINLEKVDKQSNIIIQQLAKEIRQFLELEEYPRKIDILPVYNSTFGNIKIVGDLKLLTDVLRLQGYMILINSSFKPTKINEIKIYGKVALTIKNASLLISPSESYLVIKSEGYSIEGEVLVKAPNTLIIIGKNIVHNMSTLLNFKFRSTNIFLSARLPLVNAFGNITFDKLDAHEALYVPLAGIVQQKAKFEGKVEFDTAYISNPLVIFSKFKVNGKILNLDSTVTPTIPWSEVLSSSYTLTFNIIFFLSIIFYAFKKRRAKQTITEDENGN